MSEKPATDPTSASFVPVCAIGASAGGVYALQTLFRLLPTDLGLAYVVVMHLAPDHPSAMDDILGAVTKMPVLQVTDGPTLLPDHVYIIAPDRELVIEGDDVKSRPFTDPRARRAPIDMFFRSIAAGRGDGIAVVLTGAGSDGAVGVRAIKEAGGIVMVQEPAEAGFPSMPQSAIATGVADVVAPLARLAERIVEAAQSKDAVRSLDEDGAANDIRRIIAFLRTRTGHDFSGYKRSTVLRRIARRMQVCQIVDLRAYAQHLRETPEEAKALFADLLISVTMFFRDPDTFVTLTHRVIRPLFELRNAEESDVEIRAWVVGCATGEEAYSLAILLLEEAERQKVHVPMQIFATDLDEGALATAREGRYPRSIEADVSAERLKRFFVDEETHYRISSQVRDLVLFATHSVVREPPFMRLDLVTCRNVLIYLERALQQHVCGIFHYGLKSDGYLFLGTAETADASKSQFAVVDRDARIYRALPAGPEFLPSLISASPANTGRPGLIENRPPATRFDAGEILGASHAAALEASAPPSALVDAEHGVLHLSPTVGRFVQLSAGPLSGRLPSIVRPELRLDLKLALDRVFETGQPTITRLIDVNIEGETRRVSLHLAPVPTGEGLAARTVVYFLDNGPARAATDEEPAPPLGELQHLHSELKVAQEAELAGRIRHESAVQELRASNEELQSLNEEYRSTAEELETSKEELQSINEELQTVNAELKSKLSVISSAHNDLQNLTDSSEIGTLFLDLNLRIRMFTPPVAQIINLTQADVGRPITDFTHRLDYDGIENDVRAVLAGQPPVEAEIRERGGGWFMVRVRPYRTLDGAAEGAIVTFDDITERKRADDALRESEERFRALFAASPAPFLILRPDAPRFTITEVNEAYLAATMRTRDEVVGRGLFKAYPDNPQNTIVSGVGALSASLERVLATRRSDAAPDLKYDIARPDGTFEERWWHPVNSPVLTANGEVEAIIHNANDTTVEHRAEAALRESEERQVFLLKLSDALRPLADAADIQAAATRLLGAHLGVDRAMYAEVEGEPGAETGTIRAQYVRQGEGGGQSADPFPEQFTFAPFGPHTMAARYRGEPLVIADIDAAAGFDTAERVAWAAVGVRAALVVPLVKDGRLLAEFGVHDIAPRAWTAAQVSLVQDVAERAWVAVERALAEAALNESEARFRTLAETAPALIWQNDRDGGNVFVNRYFLDYSGLAADEVGGEKWRALVHPDDSPAYVADYMAAVREQRPFHNRNRIRRHDGAWRWFENYAHPLFDEHGRYVGHVGVSIDVTTNAETERSLRDSEQWQQHLIAGVPQLVWRASDGGQWTWASPQWTDYTGQPEADSHGYGWLDPVHPEDREAVKTIWEGAVERGEFHADYRLRHAAENQYRWFQSRATPVRSDAGEIIEWLGTSTDVDDLRQLQDRQGVLVAELQHRTRNLITVVSALSSRTLDNATSLEDFDQRFGQRLAALSRVQGLLSHLAAGERVTFDALLASELAALGAPDHKVTLDGPSGVTLRSATVQIFALALHELATNAVKYGALLSKDGHLTVTWTVKEIDGEAPRLKLDWRESGVDLSKVSERPAGSGYGRELIERALSYQLNAVTTYALTKDGVWCTIDVPISATNGVNEGEGAAS